MAFGARVARKVWGKMSNERRQGVKDALLKRSGIIFGGIGVGSACCIGYYVYHIEEAPITGRHRFMIIDRPKLINLIQQEQSELLASICMGRPVLPSSHPAYAQVVPILNKVIPILNSLEPDISWTLYVLDSPDIANALCLPSGDIFVHSGLLKVCQNQDELAFILSHEVAHVMLNHGGERLSNKGLFDLLQLIVVGALWALIPSDLISFILSKWSRSLGNVLFDLPYSR